jgi:hypothetical protein
MRNTHPSRWSLPPVWPMLVGASSPPRIPDARRVEENPNGYAGKRSHPISCRSTRIGHEPDHLTAARTNPEREDNPAFALVIGLVEPSAGIEPATPSLPWNHREPLCGPPFLQVALDRQGQSYRSSFGEVMRSLCSRLALMVAMSRSSSGRIRRWTSGAAIAAARGGGFHQRCVWLKRVPCQNCILGTAHTRRAYCFGAGSSLVGGMWRS